jgi:hypothetical protein
VQKEDTSVRKTRLGLFEVVQHCAAGPLQTYQNTEYRRLDLSMVIMSMHTLAVMSLSVEK